MVYNIQSVHKEFIMLLWWEIPLWKVLWENPKVKKITGFYIWILIISG